MFEFNKIYNIDCMQAMTQFPDKYFDLAVVDPPYGIGEDGGDKILYTHIGSGSSAIACIDLKFEFIGFEIDKEYFYLTEKRINEFKEQGKLF